MLRSLSKFWGSFGLLMVFGLTLPAVAQDPDRDISNTPISELFGRVIDKPNLPTSNDTADIVRNRACVSKLSEIEDVVPKDYRLEIPAMATGLARDEALQELFAMQRLTGQISLFGELDAKLSHSKDLVKLTTLVYGSTARETTFVLNNHAMLLGESGEYVQAIKYINAAVRSSCMLQEFEGRLLFNLLSQKARMRETRGEIEKAKSLHSDLIVWRTESLGRDHADTIDSVEAFALILVEQQRANEAKPLLARTYQSRMTNRAKTDPALIASINNYANVLDRLDEHEEAEPLYRLAMELNGNIFSEDHPQFIAGLRNYATVLANLKRFDEAEKYARKAMDLSFLHLPSNHPGTPIAVHNLALILDYLGRKGQAQELEEKALELATLAYGENHPTTGKFRQDLWHAYLIDGEKPLDAVELGRKIVASIRNRRTTAGASEFDQSQDERSVARESKFFGMMADSLWVIAETAQNAH